MKVHECLGCIYYIPGKMVCCYDVESLFGEDISTFSVCRWNSRRIKNQKAAERRRQRAGDYWER